MKEFFNNKKILIVVPHQDDEINVASGLLSLDIDKKNIFVVYTTNGDFSINADIRYKEAINSLKCFGVKRDNIIFLGYSDQSYSQDTHIYTSNNNWISNKGIIKTYGAFGIKEWCYQKQFIHNIFNKNNLYKDLLSVIEEIMPDIVVGVDLDFHPDHIMTSLLLEKAIGELLHTYLDYHPIVLKTFAYENSYFGVDDFNALNEYGMHFDIMKNGILSNNPYYDDKNSLKFSLPYKAKCLNLTKNIVFKAIKKHTSQLLVLHSFQMINSNNVYWVRCTDNLLNRAKIKVSSGDASLLNDFMLADTKNILHGDQKPIFYNYGIWIPNKDDFSKMIEIKFESKEYVECMKLYSGRLMKQKIKRIKLILDGVSCEYSLNNYFVDVIEINKSVLEISIQILDEQVENGFSEIELLREENILTKVFKVNIDNTWSNNFICLNKKQEKYKLFLISNYSDCFDVKCENLKNGFVKDNSIFLSKKTTGYIDVYDCFNNYKERIYINKNVLLRKFTMFFNKVYIFFEILNCKIKRKLTRILDRKL